LPEDRTPGRVARADAAPRGACRPSWAASARPSRSHPSTTPPQSPTTPARTGLNDAGPSRPAAARLHPAGLPRSCHTRPGEGTINGRWPPAFPCSCSTWTGSWTRSRLPASSLDWPRPG